jgi:uncharacterized protein (TIGR02466 family)
MNRKQRRAEERKKKSRKAGGRAGLERHFALALADHKKGLLIEAEKGYRKVLAVDSGHPFALNNLSVIANQTNDPKAALEFAERTLALKPDYAEAHCNKANALAELGRLDEAVAGYGQALALKPGYAEAHNNKGNTLRKLERLEEAAEAFARALAINPDFYQARANLADVRLQQGDPAAALELCESALARKPGDTAVLALKGVVLWDLGQAEEARALVDFDRFIRHELFTPPPAYADLSAFNGALARHVEGHPTLIYAPLNHTTRQAWHSGDLLSQPKGPIADLEAGILAAVEDYGRNLGRDSKHPFLAHPPANLSLTVWSVVMRGQGHQIAHIHPAAWLSGVYYPQVPEFAGDGKDDGCIEFGRPPDHFHNQAEPETRSILPQAGLLVLFPSYFFHRTIPFDSGGTRISIAFDLITR